MTRLVTALVRLAIKTARPDWTLAALATLPAAGVAEALRFAFG